MARKARVFTIPASAPFLPTLASAMLDGALVPGFAPRNDPLALAGATVFLPTRRSARVFEYSILDALGTEAALLPRIVPLGDLDEDALAFSEDQPAEDVWPAVSTTERRLTLARLVAGFSQSGMIASSPASAIKLADELARLFDDLTIAGVDIEKLDEKNLVPTHLDEFWQKSLEFLKIAHRAWHEYLAEQKKMDPAERRDLLLQRKAEDLRSRKGGPFIVAGSTGTIPAVARLIAAIAGREDGAVVLPGLDQLLDEPSFNLIEQKDSSSEDAASFSHPQFGLKRLLARLEVKRADVTVLGESMAPAREALLSEASRPAASTDLWNSAARRLSQAEAEAAVEGISVIEAADPREEALAATVILRQSIEDKNRRAAFVTHDRTLARRVASELRRWNINVDDSAGVPLSETEAGRFARLLAAAAAEELAPVALLAFLRHPLNSLSKADIIDALELAVLRGPRPASGAKGLTEAIESARAQKHHRRDRRAQLTDAQWKGALALAKEIARALEPLLRFSTAGPQSCANFIGAHRECLKRCGFELELSREDGAFELRKAFAALEQSASILELDLSSYAAAFAELLRGEPPVRRDFDPDDRIRILGPLEARLLHVDLILIGGLNEGVWPPEAHADAWLNRSLRQQLGLDLPERRIGLAAHDFTQAVASPIVVLSRSKKQNGVETVASRFLQRLAAIAPEAGWKAAHARGEGALSLARALESRAKAHRLARPEPRPAADIRPDRLSVTDIETLVRDPYSIYARDILSLSALEEIDADPGAAERGNLLHEAFAAFGKAFPRELPENAYDELIRFGRIAFEPLRNFPGVQALWWPRFERAARWLIKLERERRQTMQQTFVETSGAKEIDLDGRKFTLTARADRIDLHQDGGLSIIDYKTGAPPTLPQAATGLAPQLPLEAAIARAGGFPGIPENSLIREIAVIRLTGAEPPGEIKYFDPSKARSPTKELFQSLKVSNENDLAALCLARCVVLLKEFSKSSTAYHSIPRPKWRGRFGRYDHLARIKEWSADGGGEE